MKTAVTGASGFIGRHLVAALRERGDTAIIIRRPFDPATLSGDLAGVDAVVHLAGVIAAVHERDFVEGNVDATRIVAQSAATAGVRMIHISSLAAAGPAPVSSPRTEDDACAPMTPYGRSKLEGERVVASTAGLRWTILRPGVVYGPGDHALRPLFKMARMRLMFAVGRPGAAYTFIHITDTIRAMLAAIDRDVSGETIFLGHSDPVTPSQLVQTIRDATGRAAVVVPVPLTIVRLAAVAGDLAGALTGRPSFINSRRYTELASEGFVCCVDRMRDRLGVVAEINLERGLADAAKWYREEGWI